MAFAAAWRRLARHAGGAPTGLGLFGALAIAFQSVIWSTTVTVTPPKSPKKS